MTFEEDFPSLKGRRILTLSGIVKFDIIYTKYVKKHCLDKRKVREVIDKLFPNDGTGINLEWKYGSTPKEDLLEQLGLEE